MKPVNVAYLDWAKRRHTGKPITLDLSNSGMPAPDRSWLGLSMDHVDLLVDNGFGYPPLRKAVARRFGVDPDRVLLGPGTAGTNFLVCAVLCKPGDKVIVERPAYEPLYRRIEALGCEVVWLDRHYNEGFALQPERLRSLLASSDAKAVIVTNLHNPTGVYAPEATIDACANVAAEANAHLLVDEVYLEYLETDIPPAAATRHPHVISTSSLTKAYGLGGLRCGWAIAPAEVVTQALALRNVLDGCGVSPADTLALHCHDQLEKLRNYTWEHVRTTRPLVDAWIASRPELDWVAPDAGVIGFPRLSSGLDASVVAQTLRSEHGLLIVPGSFFGMPSHFRLAWSADVGTVKRGLDCIGQALESLT